MSESPASLNHLAVIIGNQTETQFRYLGAEMVAGSIHEHVDEIPPEAMRQAFRATSDTLPTTTGLEGRITWQGLVLTKFAEFYCTFHLPAIGSPSVTFTGNEVFNRNYALERISEHTGGEMMQVGIQLTPIS